MRPFAYHDPHDTHGGSVINDNDRDTDPDKRHHQPPGVYVVGADHDEPADVTVSDLLDAWDDNDDARWNRLVNRASVNAYSSASRIRHASIFGDPSWLSPAERAEFDRRTT